MVLFIFFKPVSYLEYVFLVIYSFILLIYIIFLGNNFLSSQKTDLKHLETFICHISFYYLF